MILVACLKILRIILITICCLNTASVSSQHVQQKKKEHEAWLVAAENYLKSIRSLESSFLQSSTTGKFAHGTLFLHRPGKLRIKYKSPRSLQVYANGTWLFYIDNELKEISQIPLEKTPAFFLINDRFRFSEGLKVLNIIKEAGTLKIKIASQSDEREGAMTLILSEQADSFIGWTVTDTQGVNTNIKLLDPIINKPIAEGIFSFSIPDWAFLDYQQD